MDNQYVIRHDGMIERFYWREVPSIGGMWTTLDRCTRYSSRESRTLPEAGRWETLDLSMQAELEKAR